MHIDHGYSYKDEDSEFVTLVNPNNSWLEDKIPIKEFYGNLRDVTIAKYKKNDSQE